MVWPGLRGKSGWACRIVFTLLLGWTGANLSAEGERSSDAVADGPKERLEETGDLPQNVSNYDPAKVQREHHWESERADEFRRQAKELVHQEDGHDRKENPWARRENVEDHREGIRDRREDVRDRRDGYDQRWQSEVPGEREREQSEGRKGVGWVAEPRGLHWMGTKPRGGDRMPGGHGGPAREARR